MKKNIHYSLKNTCSFFFYIEDYADLKKNAWNTHNIAEFITLSDYRFVNIETFQVCKKTFCRYVKLEHPADLVTLNILQICKHTSCSFESIKHQIYNRVRLHMCKITFCRFVKLEHPADLVTMNTLQICKHRTSWRFGNIEHVQHKHIHILQPLSTLQDM